MPHFRHVSRIERPPHFKQESLGKAWLDEERVGAGNPCGAQIGLLREFRHDDDNSLANILPLANRADEGEPVDVSSGEDEIRDDDFRAKDGQDAQCGFWPGHAAGDHPMVSKEGHVHHTRFRKSIDDKHPTGPIDVS